MTKDRQQHSLEETDLIRSQIYSSLLRRHSSESNMNMTGLISVTLVCRGRDRGLGVGGGARGQDLRIHFAFPAQHECPVCPALPWTHRGSTAVGAGKCCPQLHLLLISSVLIPRNCGCQLVLGLTLTASLQMYLGPSAEAVGALQNARVIATV